MSLLYELITFPLSLFDNPIYDIIVMSIIGSISFTIAWRITGDLDIGGGLGSIVHWTIRLISTLIIWSAVSLTIMVAKLIIKYWLFLSISVILLTVLYVLSIHANKKKDSVLNREVL